MRAFDSAVKVYTSAADEIIDQAAAGNEVAAGSLAAKLVELSSREDSPLQRSEVMDEVVGLLLAGHETSSNTATWALHLLATHPAAQEEVRAEVAGLDLQSANLHDLYACPLLQATDVGERGVVKGGQGGGRCSSLWLKIDLSA